MRFKSMAFLLAVLTMLLFISCEKELFSPQTQEMESENFESLELEKHSDDRGGQVSVMTWNIYVGADVDPILAASDPNEVPLLVAAAWQELQATSFEERAETMAKFVKRYRPHLIGLQEVSLIQRFASPDPASLEEQLDYLAIFMEKLSDRGLSYQIAGKVDNADITVPRLADPTTFALDYVRLLDSDVVLARQDVSISNVASGNFQAELPVPGFGITIPRGYVAVNAMVRNTEVRFVNTHLESFTELVRLPQAQELAAILAAETLPVILTGDLNTLAPGDEAPDGGVTYQFLTGDARYQDIWLHSPRRWRRDGFTASHASDLRNPAPDLTKRIDYIMTRSQDQSTRHGHLGWVKATVLGDQYHERTASGMWPSDHAGVIARLRVR